MFLLLVIYIGCPSNQRCYCLETVVSLAYAIFRLYLFFLIFVGEVYTQALMRAGVEVSYGHVMYLRDPLVPHYIATRVQYGTYFPGGTYCPDISHS